MQDSSSDATPATAAPCLRNLVTSVLVEDRVETTVAKAKAVRPHVEKMITLGKKGDLSLAPSGTQLPDDRQGRHAPL